MSGARAVSAQGTGLDPGRAGCDLLARPSRSCDPESAVSALCGRERILRLYGEAIECGYRFDSYGDAMLLLP